MEDTDGEDCDAQIENIEINAIDDLKDENVEVKDDDESINHEATIDVQNAQLTEDEVVQKERMAAKVGEDRKPDVAEGEEQVVPEKSNVKNKLQRRIDSNYIHSKHLC